MMSEEDGADHPINGGPAARREAVAHLQAAMGLSERRACSIVGADRKMVRYRSCRPSETELRGRLRELPNERRRFDYRKLFILLRREGEPSGINRIYRHCREERLTVRKRRGRRRAVGTGAPWSRQGQMRGGHWTSCMTSLPAGGASVC